MVCNNGRNLRRLRERQGVPQAAVARALGKHPGFISDLENGVRVMTPRMALQLAEALKEKDPRELVAQALNIVLKREGVEFRVSKGGLKTPQ